MSDPSIEFFPVANGDMTLITTKNEKRILIDCNYRQPSDEVVDVKEMLRGRLKRNEDDQRLVVPVRRINDVVVRGAGIIFAWRQYEAVELARYHTLLKFGFSWRHINNLSINGN